MSFLNLFGGAKTLQEGSASFKQVGLKPIVV